MLSIPGYSTIAEFAKENGLAYMTVRNHMLRGRCAYPRKIDDGITKHPLYKIWEGVVQRTTNPKTPNYIHYGGRGIIMDITWICNARKFIEDIEKYIGTRPSPKHTIDRIDVNGNYVIENLRWATSIEQASNTRKNLGNLKYYSQTVQVRFANKYYGVFPIKEGEQLLEDMRAMRKVGRW